MKIAAYRFGKRGFTLLELLIVLAILAILAAVSALTFSAFLDKSRTTSVVRAGHMIRTALDTYALGQSEGYPARLDDYDALHQLVNAHGGTLRPSEQHMGFQFQQYTSSASQSDGTRTMYVLHLKVIGVPSSRQGWCVILSPQAIALCDPE